MAGRLANSRMRHASSRGCFLRTWQDIVMDDEKRRGFQRFKERLCKIGLQGYRRKVNSSGVISPTKEPAQPWLQQNLQSLVHESGGLARSCARSLSATKTKLVAEVETCSAIGPGGYPCYCGAPWVSSNICSKTSALAFHKLGRGTRFRKEPRIKCATYFSRGAMGDHRRVDLQSSQAPRA